MGFLGELLNTIGERGRALIYRQEVPKPAESGRFDLGALEKLCEVLISVRGEASGVVLAQKIVAQWEGMEAKDRERFLLALAERFGADKARLDTAVEAYRGDPSAASILELHVAAEPRRQELIRRLNLAPNGISTLVAMREALLGFERERPELNVVDADFQHLFGSWFNRGFLVLKRIDWSTPANILEKIIRYEAVHEISSWSELRLRLEPTDRRCFAFFHPQLVDEPLIFVEVALATSIPSSIGTVLLAKREPIAAESATTAAFYSISNCQKGLRGVSFGNFLIKQVVEDLKRELPALSTFVTLSPVPGFARWLAQERASGEASVFSDEDRALLALLDDAGWAESQDLRAKIEPVLAAAAAQYLLKARRGDDRPADPVSRFHLGNGARLEQINFCGDLSANGMRQSHGIMVNYLYKLDDIEQNHEAYAAKGEVAASAAVRKLLRPEPKAGGRGPQRPLPKITPAEPVKDQMRETTRESESA